MVSNVLLALCVVVAVAAALPGAAGPPGAPGGLNPWIPPWLASAPWFPQWTPCTAIGSTCLDCTTRLVCTKIGGLQRACTDPTLPYCNLGACSATPSAECAAPAVNA
ncbi:uncharacterized protein LOC113231380 [Hyposmocoma kahamanoa]|uniref:uncharacterized protein LOC113231380 n=1 Tax=Hyposmocoma kahamanoa TaxID=1477025 RepID=UPI000E6D78B0|nr:uncharacterized protein LOC113231380 [Hyposmocoma kahamanoa]